MVSGSRDFELRERCDHDRRVVLTRLSLLVSAAAMIATSAPPTYFYEFAKEVPGPPVALTSDATQATYLVTVRITGEAPNGTAVKLEQVRASGEIVADGAADGTFVNVSLRGVPPGTGEPELNALASFDLTRGLAMAGCSGATACEASFVVDFVRSDGGDNGGTLNVDWSLVLSARAHKGEDGPSEGPLELPCTVEFTAQ